MQVDGGGLDAAVAQQPLHDVDVGALLQQMSGETVAKKLLT